MKIRNPIEWEELELDEVDIHRLDLCPFYDQCLLEAGIAKWKGFSCIKCKVFIEERVRERQGKPSLIPAIRNLSLSKDEVSKL